MPRRPIIAMVLVSGLLAACGGSETSEAGPSPTPTATGSPTTEPPSSPSPTRSVSPSIEPEIEDGRHFGYIRSIDPVSETIVFDLAYFLTGDEANEEAARRGDETPVPNDYYIVNDNPRLRTLRYTSALELHLIDWTNCCDTTFDEGIGPFAEAIAANHPDPRYLGRSSPYWLTVEDGIVRIIQEQYLP